MFGLSKKKKISQDSQTTEEHSLLKRFTDGLKRTRQRFSSGLEKLLLGKKTIDAELLQSLRTLLISTDMGVTTTDQVLNTLSKNIERQALTDPNRLLTMLKKELVHILAPCEQPINVNHTPFVFLIVGVNGAGKTTTIAKLAHFYQSQGQKVMLAAGDTFRAAAIEQLTVWGERSQIPVIAQHIGADSASVIYDAMAAAKQRNYDILIADTAGRLTTKHHLMNELAKIKRVMAKFDPEAPQETMLILDGTTGQNALQQTKQFHETIGISGITLTKLDGTAKGGTIFAIANQCKIPIRFIGLGEEIDDLKPFQAEAFVSACCENTNVV